MSPSLSRLDPRSDSSYRVLKFEGRQGDPQHLTELKRYIKREVRGISSETCRKVLREARKLVTQEKAGFSSTSCSGGVVERGDAGPVPKKSPRNVL